MYTKGQDGFFLTDMREMLRVKVKSLAAEIRIIRREELRTWGFLREKLYYHRCDLREEAYTTLLAYAVVRGRMEQAVAESLLQSTVRKLRMLDNFKSMLNKYGAPRVPVRVVGTPPLRCNRSARFAHERKRKERQSAVTWAEHKGHRCGH